MGCEACSHKNKGTIGEQAGDGQLRSAWRTGQSSLHKLALGLSLEREQQRGMKEMKAIAKAQEPGGKVWSAPREGNLGLESSHFDCMASSFHWLSLVHSAGCLVDYILNNYMLHPSVHL